MQLRTRRIAFLALALWTLCGNLALADGKVVRSIDPTRSNATFTVKHIFVSHVSGSIPIVAGRVVLSPNSLVPLQVRATLDPNGVHTDSTDRDAALRGPEFFDVKKFPTWTFASTAIVAHGNAAFTMDGVLTIHGVPQHERLNVTIGGDAAHPVYRATGTIDRRAFGMAVTRLDPVIGGTVEVTIEAAIRGL